MKTSSEIPDGSEMAASPKSRPAAEKNSAGPKISPAFGFDGRAL
jgi:hypothetical protein